MEQYIDELYARCIQLLHKSIVVDQKIPSLQGVCEILNAIKDFNKPDNEDVKSLLITLLEQSEKEKNLALIKSNIADTL